MEFGAFGLWHIAQTLIERLRSDKECGVQQGAVNLALEDAGAIEIEKALYEHFARAIEALAEGCILKQYERRNERRQSCCHIAERGLVPRAAPPTPCGGGGAPRAAPAVVLRARAGA